MDFQSTHKGLGVSHVLYNMLSPFAEVSTAFVGNCCHVHHHMHVNFTTSFLIAVLLAGTTQPRLTTQIGTKLQAQGLPGGGLSYVRSGGPSDVRRASDNYLYSVDPS